MKKSSLKYFSIGVLCIVICISLAYVLQSAYLLYAASILPFFILPFLPDFATDQKIFPLKKDKSIQVYGVTASDQTPSYVVIEFKPGRIQWSKKILYFSADHVAVAPTKSLKQDAVALPVLKYDLILKKGKYRWVGIQLNHLIERSGTFPFRMKEVNRLVISIQDIKDLFKETSVSRKMTVKKSKQMQA
jgi:hypothetical protein